MPAPRKYPAELRDRTVRLVFEIREESGEKRGAIGKVATQLGFNPEILRSAAILFGADLDRRQPK